ncbi:MAG TPA: GNAT family N-acetyltransferase [bacterium]|jgi:ribosomal-protein-alanine N-acetyltransferase
MINPHPEFAIDAATLADVDGIDRIEREAFKTPWSRDLLRAAILNEAYRVRTLRTGGEGLLGFYIAHAMRGRSNLDNLAVDRILRSRGWGSLLLDDWMGDARAQGLDSLSLQVNTANIRAQKLYEHFHFKTTKLLVAYYPNGDDAYQMERSVGPAPSLQRAPGSRRYWLAPRRGGWLGGR